MFLMLEDGGGRLVSVHLYIKARRVTEQPLTAGTPTVHACKQQKGYSVFIRTQTLRHTAAQHGIETMEWDLCLVPATVPTALSYITMFLLPCFHPSSFSEPAYSEPVQRVRTGGREENSHPSFGDTVLKGRVKSKHFEKQFTQNK